jgi:hypothetical protein
MKKICLLVFTSKIARTLQRVIISTLLVNTFLVLTILSSLNLNPLMTVYVLTPLKHFTNTLVSRLSSPE